VILILTGPCSAFSSVQSQKDEQSTTSSTGSNIRRAWEEKCKNLSRNTKGDAKRMLDVLLELLRTASQAEVQHEFETVLASNGAPSEYDKILLEAFLVRLVEKNDRFNLVRLLSVNCPRFVVGLPLELFLATNMTDGVLVLFDSYDTAKDISRKTLSEIIDSAFRFLKSRFSANTFMQKSKEWYLRNRTKITINPLYNRYDFGQSHRVLFIFKT
jgi:hypothetical protein